MTYIYLHGFASGPSSGKAQFFAARFSERGIPLEIPDLAEGDFENLTISGQLSVVGRLAGTRPVTLIGSSMGGYLAALYASLHAEAHRLVLLAPAFGFPRRWPDQLGPEKAADWRESGFLSVWHYSDNCERRLSWRLMEDARTWPDAPTFSQPALIFHGMADDVVPYKASVEFGRTHPNATVRLLASDHQLTDAVETIWTESAAFLFD